MATKSKTNGAISDFINSLASSPVGQEVGNTANNLRQTFQVPVQQIAHAALPKIVPDVTPQQQQQAEQGSEFGIGAIQGQPEADALAPSINVAADTVKTAGKAALQSGKETIQTAKAQPGGLQAGFIKLPSIGKSTPVENINTGDLTEAQVGRATPENPAGKNPIQNLDLSKKYGVRAPAHEKAAQETLNTQVPGANASEVYDNLDPTIGKLNKQIDQVVGDNPSTASKIYPNGVTYQDLAEDMQAKANAQGLMKTPEGAKAVNKAIAQQINYISGNADVINGATTAQSSATPIFNDDLSPATIKGTPSAGTTQFRRMGGAKAGTGGPPGYLKELPVKDGEAPIETAQPSTAYNPSQMESASEGDIFKAQQALDMPTLRNEYKAANGDNAALLKRRSTANGKPLSDTESAQLLYRDSLGDAISTTNPAVKDLITQQSHIYDSVPDVAKARTQYRNDLLDKQAADAKAANASKPSIVDRMKQHPVGSVLLAGGAGYGVTKLPEIAGAAAGLVNSAVQNMNPSKSTPLPAINQKPTYSMITPLDDGTLISQQQQAQRQSALQAKIGAEAVNNPVQAAADKGTYDSNETEFNSQGDLRNISTQTKTLVNSANNAAIDLAQADPSTLNALSEGYDAMAKANGGKYAQLAADLKTLDNLSGVDLTTAKSKDALQAAITAIVKNQQIKMQALQAQYSGSGTKQISQAPAPIQEAPQAKVNWQGNSPFVNNVMSGGAPLPLIPQ